MYRLETKSRAKLFQISVTIVNEQLSAMEARSARKRQDKSTATNQYQYDFDGLSNHQFHEHYQFQPDEEKHEASDLRGDRANISLLFFLYLLQGIPIGLTAAVPMLLQNRGASYKQQVLFEIHFVE